VAGDHDHPGQLEAGLLDQVDSGIVEVVGRFVQQQAGRPAGQGGGHRKPTTFASGEGCDPAPAIQPGHPEPLGGDLGSPVGPPGVVILGPGQRIRVRLFAAAVRE
jgi:hypothetical protein